MIKLIKYSQTFIAQQFINANLEIVQTKSGREGVDFVIKANTGNLHEIYLQPINLNKERSVKILKQDLGEPKNNLWVALVLILDYKAISLYLIPSKTLTKPDNFVYMENEVSSFPQLSNWEIKVFKNGMQKLSEFSLDNMLKDL
jgi:hypothetical protein